MLCKRPGELPENREDAYRPHPLLFFLTCGVTLNWDGPPEPSPPYAEPPSPLAHKLRTPHPEGEDLAL
ncbi:hypothetical protein [Marinithermus hydrothermalis]|uniref:Uncharacterized protein n=1 Tax=Marinithermus hydrothermalis (strain DSM 14884 / JCM 11576 / T1) TaxID=869210 RepID=F2NR77_MARHT|nr:hypothetical protein [Marinithermus hydrothermalis]AEB12926.1 hypothetical protein Marky_2206 [Marinithermus hydrothermalis DSM 14884]